MAGKIRSVWPRRNKRRCWAATGCSTRCCKSSAKSGRASEESLAARSPLEKYDDVEKDLREKWEDELAAAVEAEYRRQRADLLLLVQWWLRDVWLHSIAAGRELLNFPKIAGAEAVAGRLSPRQALENLQTLEQTQRLLHTNVQEALALEVGLLKLHF